MFKFMEKKRLDCLCCGQSMRAPQEAQVVRCSKCYSEITAIRENLVEQSLWKLLVLLSAVPVLSFLFGDYFQSHAALFGFLSTVVVLAINKYLFGSYFFDSKPVIHYVYVHGHSFPEEIQLRRERLHGWLERGDSDFIGFIRFLFNTDYVWDNLDDQSQNLLMKIHDRADTLPGREQLSGWNSATLDDDLRRVDVLKAEYLPEMRPIIEKLRDSPLNYQA